MYQNKKKHRIEYFELKAQEFISLTFDIYEHELRLHRKIHALSHISRDKSLPFAVFSVQNSIKTFLAIVRIERE